MSGVRRVLAITHPDNAASIRLLGRLRFRLEGQVGMSAAGPETNVFAQDRTGGDASRGPA